MPFIEAEIATFVPCPVNANVVPRIRNLLLAFDLMIDECLLRARVDLREERLVKFCQWLRYVVAWDTAANLTLLHRSQHVLPRGHLHR